MKRIIIVMLLTALAALGGFGQEEDALVVDPYGNVGIGPGNPTQKLHIFDGSLRLDSLNGIYLNGDSDNSVFLRSDAHSWHIAPWGTNTQQSMITIGGGGIQTDLSVNGNISGAGISGSTLNVDGRISGVSVNVSGAISGGGISGSSLSVSGNVSANSITGAAGIYNGNITINIPGGYGNAIYLQGNSNNSVFLHRNPDQWHIAPYGTNTNISQIHIGGGGVTTNLAVNGNVAVSGAITDSSGRGAGIMDTTGNSTIRFFYPANGKLYFIPTVLSTPPPNTAYALPAGALELKTFVIDHPQNPGKYLVHATLEGPEGAVFYRGTANLENGRAEISLPSYFEALTREQGRTILLSNIDGFDRICVRKVNGAKINNGKFVVISDNPASTQEFDWEVKAVRSDVDPLVVEPDKEDLEVRGDGPYTYGVLK